MSHDGMYREFKEQRLVVVISPADVQLAFWNLVCSLYDRRASHQLK